MSNHRSLSVPLKPLFSLLLLLALSITCTSSARILDEDETPVPTNAPVTPVSVVTPAAATSAAAAGNADPLHHPLIFFMHDILGGSNPSAIAVTGIVANPAVSGQVAFAKPNGANLPLNNGVPVKLWTQEHNVV